MEKKSPFCTLSDAELTQKAKELIQELIDSGGKSWVMNIPARPNSDPDLIFTELNERFKKSQETIKVLTYDNNKLKGEVEGLKNAVEELKTKYDNILATESGHESKTENVWQSGYAAGHEAGCERGKREAQPRAVWVKASEFKIEYGPNYYAKWMDGKIKATGHFQESDGTFFWNVPGYIPIGKHEYEHLYILDESAAGREEPVEFLTWIRENEYTYNIHNGGYWYELDGKLQETFLCDTDAELYELFKQQNTKA